MFLISPQQLERLRRPTPDIRMKAEQDLDEKIKDVLEDRSLSQYEKIKKYESLMQRYLSLVKQGEKEIQNTAVTLARDTSHHHQLQSALKTPAKENEEDENAGAREEEDVVKSEESWSELVQNFPHAYRKNAIYVVKKLLEHGRKWTRRNEFIYQNDVVRGSHMTDLLKHLTATGKSAVMPAPRGWEEFLQTLYEINIPESVVSNPRAREQFRDVKLDGGLLVGDNSRDRVSRSKKRRPSQRKKKSPPTIHKWIGFKP